MKTRLDQKFFRSTRGRIVTLLRAGAATVEELAAKLHLTDNAVRAHLATLERDHLIEQKGVKRSVRKPHYQYSLTSEAEHLFPKSYDTLLNQLLQVLKLHLPADKLEEVLREVGRSLAKAQGAHKRSTDLESRMRRAMEILEELGGAPKLEADGRKLTISSGSCPLSVAVAEHPEVCHLAEALVSYIVGRRAKEDCDRTETPRCRFEVLAG